MDVYKCSGCHRTTESTNVQKVTLSPESLQAMTAMLDKPTSMPSVMMGGFRSLLSIAEHS